MTIFQTLVRGSAVLGLVAMLGAVAPQQATAAVLISNLDGNDGTQTGILTADRVKAMGFTIGAGAGFRIDRVTLRLETTGPSMTVLLDVRADDGGAPGATVLGAFDSPVLAASGISNYDFTPSAPLTLDGGATYWLVASGSGPDTVAWKASSPGVVPTGIATHAGSLFSGTGLSGLGSSGILNSYAIEATSAAVPLPATLPLLLGALGAVAVLRRRRTG